MTRALAVARHVEPRLATDKEVDLFRRILKYASEKSKDPSSQNAAALVERGNLKLKVLEENRFPTNVEETPERWERPLKYDFIEHAERNCIYRAAEEGIPTRLMVMYCPWFACHECARGIVQANLSKVVGLYWPEEEKHPGWVNTCETGNIILDEAGIKREYVTIPKLGIKVRRNYNIIEL